MLLKPGVYSSPLCLICLLYTVSVFSARFNLMNLRKPILPPGWYFQNPQKIDEFLKNFVLLDKNTSKSSGEPSSAGRILAAAAPHAGWYYSGAVAALAVSTLMTGLKNPDTVAVIGGHLPGGMPALFAMEDGVSTPLGVMEMDKKFRDGLLRAFEDIPDFKSAEDKYQDNTVEVLLPMVKYFFPDAKLLWLRLPAVNQSFEAGKIIAKTAAELDRSILVLGSTDLTHYGPNYGFTPNGNGKEALDWVKNVNDKRFIDAVEEGNSDLALERAEAERSSCSAGAILGVMGFAAGVHGNETHCGGKLLAYATSADISIEEGEGIPDSFVGYGAFVWEK
jgi:AmmeMemoRadiSam system protein B